jgi:hypothetical protein
MSWQCQSQDDVNATLDYIGHFANYDEEKDQAVLSIIPLQALQHILSTWIWKSTNDTSKNGTQNTDHPAHQTPLNSQIQNWYTAKYQEFRNELDEAEDKWRRDIRNHPVNRMRQTRTVYPLRIKWITSNESEENSPMERSYFRDTTFRNTKGRTVNKEPLFYVVTRSKAKTANEKDTGEGSRELVIQQPVPTRTIQEDITKMEDEVEEEVELEEPGRVMDEEWMRNYTKDLILPKGGLPKDLLTEVIRVVNGKHYHLDQYLEKAFKEELTPLETNI